MDEADPVRTIQIGVVLPQGRLLLDRGALEAFAHAVQDLGYRHILSFDHVLGADPLSYAGRPLPYNTSDPFHELFTAFAFITACAPRLAFCAGVLVLPQRQTALVAKQAAEVDFLSGGRLRIGIGSGWNDVEYQALGVPWSDRGRRLDEQIEVLRLLWTQESVSYTGTFHVIRGAGLNPLPIQQPIPIWVGGESERALRRATLLGDGYILPGQPPASPDGTRWPGVFEQMRRMRHDAGRGADSFGFEVRPIPGAISEWDATARDWEAIGATHLSITTLGEFRGRPAHRRRERQRDSTTSVEDHIAELEQVRSVLAPFFSSPT